jgi:hypothetical protein
LPPTRWSGRRRRKLRLRERAEQAAPQGEPLPLLNAELEDTAGLEHPSEAPVAAEPDALTLQDAACGNGRSSRRPSLLSSL